MSDDKIKTTLELDVVSTGQENLESVERTIAKLTANLAKLVATAKAAEKVLSSLGKGKATTATGTSTAQNDNRSVKEALGIDRDRLRVLKMQMGYQAKERAEAIRAAEREVRAEQRAFRQKLAFATSIGRQRIAEERAVQREIERTDRARQAGERATQREQARSRKEASSRFSDAGRHGRDAYSRLSRAPAAGAAVAGAGAAAVTRKAFRSELEVDSAEIDARIYGELTKDLARELRDKWAAPLSEQLGVSTAKLLTSYTDALKLGIPNAGAKAFSELATKTSEAWAIPFDSVVDILGTINTILTSKGEAFDSKKLHSVANTIQVLAAGMSTTPEKMLSFAQRGAGAAQVLGMSQEGGIAFGAASTSLGNQAGQSGRLYDYIASRLVELPQLVRKKGAEGDHARSMIRELGYGNAANLDAKRRADPDAFLPNFLERMNKVQNPKKKDELLRFFSGREWFGELGRMVEGIETYKKAVQLQKDAKNTDAIEGVWNLHLEKLKTIVSRIRAGFINLMTEVGKVFGPVLSQFSDYFLQWTRKLSADGGITRRIQAMVDGIVEGIGFRNIPDMLKGIFGEPGEGSAGTVEAFKATTKAFVEGLRDIFGAVRSVVSAFSAGDPEIIARWTGRIIALSAALVVLSPVIAVIGAFGSAIGAFSAVVLGAWRLMRAAGIVGGAAAGAGGAGAGAAAGAGAGAAGGVLGALSRLFGAAAAPGTMGLTQGDQGRMYNRLGRWALDREQQGGPGGIPQRARGGFVFGPGTSTSDSIMARLSNGEFVVNADAAYRHRGLLEAINSNAPGFARGGSVGGGSYNPETLFPSLGYSDEMLKRLAVAVEELVKLTKNEVSNSSGTRRLNDLVRQIGDPVGSGAGGPAITGSVGQGVVGGIRDRAAAATQGATPGGGYEPGSGLGTMPRNGIVRRGPGGGSGSSPAPEGPTTAIPGALNPRLAGSRKSLMDELDRDPALRRDVIKTASMENRGSPEKMQAVLESMVNRAKMNGYTSLRQAIHSGFYGPVNRGGLSGALSDKDRRDGEAALAQVKAGSNMIGYRTDQGMLTDPGARRYMREPDRSGHRVIGGENYFYMGQRGRNWARQQKSADAAAGAGSSSPNEGPTSAAATAGLNQSRGHYRSQIDVEGRQYDYGSGGNRGARSVPVGTYKITPDALGPWGRRNGSIGIAGGQMWDATEGRMRTGIQMHTASNARMITSGCLGIARQQYGAFKAHVMDVIRRQGSAYLTVGEDGHATITGGAAGAAAAAATAAAGGGRGTRQAIRSRNETGEVANRLNQPPVGTNRQDDLVQRPGAAGNPGSNITANVPMPRAGGPGQNQVGPVSQRGGLGGGGGVNLTIHAAHLEAEAMANAVERRLGDAMRRRTHDTDFGWG